MSLIETNVLYLKDEKSLEWENMFVIVKNLVYRRDPILNITVCMSKLSLEKYNKLGLGKKEKQIKNSISLTN